MKNLHGHAAVREEFLPKDATGLFKLGKAGRGRDAQVRRTARHKKLYRKLRRTAFFADGLYYPAVGALFVFGESREGAFFCVSGTGTRKE